MSSLSQSAIAAGDESPRISLAESEFFASGRFSVSDSSFTGLPTFPVASGLRLAPAAITPAAQGSGSPTVVTWQNAVGVSALSGSLTKTGNTGWNAGALSTQYISYGNGYVEFTATLSSNDVLVGLGNGDSSQSYEDIEFAIYTSAYNSNAVFVIEGGVNRGAFSTFTAGDRFRVAVEGGAVKYYKLVNGSPVLFYTSAVAPQYPLAVDTALHWTGDQVTNVVLSAGGTTATGTGLFGKYYDNIDLTGYKLTRTDPTVDFEWHAAAPDPSIDPNTFSVVWTGMVRPRYTGTYTFYTQSDDGVRLWVDGQQLVDKWIDQGWTEWSGTIALEADRPYSVRMEFYENGGGAIAKLLWSGPSQPKEVIPQSRLDACFKSVEQFVRDFYQAALTRQPNSVELQDWTARLTLAQDETQLVAEAQALGRTLFESAEYTARNPNDNHLFVSDLYRGYMQRTPDAGGWAWWEGQVNQYGRGTGISSFEGSGEFRDKVRRLCGTSASAGATGYDFAVRRVETDNATGGEGVNPQSRNFNWGIPLLSLPGRAGLDLDLALSYNSLVWTKDATGSAVAFDADFGNPSPGFRLGLPVLQGRYYNARRGRDAYMMITPSGGRVELLRVGTSNLYESADSSYLRLIDYGSSLSLLTTSGTRLGFESRGGDFQCTEVKDRNGNYISINYNQYGQISAIIDTLGRTVSFNYDSYQNLISITQPWKRELDNGAQATETHAWATFGYENLTLQPSFQNLAVMGTQPGTVIPVLKQVGLDDGSYYKFYYTPFGQVYKITHFAADSVVNGMATDTHPLSYVRYNLPGSDLVGVSPQSDCPRFTESRNWAEYSVGDVKNSPEIVTVYSAWAPNASSCEVTLPDPTPNQAGDEVTQKEFYATSGWQRGQVIRSEVWAGGALRKWTDLTWEHDGAPNDLHAVNPRVRESGVNDSDNNHRHTEVTYTAFGLPSVIKEKSDTSTVLRRTEIDYRIDPTADAAYLNRRIIGLVRERRLYDASGALLAKVGYIYDDASDQSFLQALPSPATQHDPAYGSAFTTRGNVNRVRRYDVSSLSAFVETQTGYNVTGSLAFTRDAAGHKTSVGYGDSFYSAVNRSYPTLQTFAYQTSVTVHETAPVVLDVVTTLDYNYDLGVPVTVTVPKGGVTSFEAGPQIKTFHDAAGRVRKTVNLATGAHSERVFDAAANASQTFTTISDASITNPALRHYAATVFTGDGKVRGTARDLPVVGAPGRYAGERVLYNALGRAEYRSNPTEMTVAGGLWSPAGDDQNGGEWRWARQQYDWMGRPTVTTNIDGTTREAAYGGCGCAGGAVLMLTDEGTLVGDGSQAVLKRRRQKVYHDALGRAVKAESLDWDGNVYSTTKTAYNGRDQIESVTTYQGTDAAGNASQQTLMTYDGHGRLKTQQSPEQTNPVSYLYNADDTMQAITDPRGVTSTYTYIDRHQVRKISYAVPSGISPAVEPTAEVTFGYDAAGNRISMVDGAGAVTYSYNTMSQLAWEERSFAGLTGAYRLTYEYTLAGRLKKITDHEQKYVQYDYDGAGQMQSVTGTPIAGVSTFASDFAYRAWGALKSVRRGDGRTQSMTYNGRLQLAGFEIVGATPQGQPVLMKAAFEYNADGRVRFMDDQLDDHLDRAYEYDYVGRLSRGLSGLTARLLTGRPSGNGEVGPYSQSYAHDVWGNLKQQMGEHWTESQSFAAIYTNNRRQGWTYDASGNVLQDDSAYGRRMTYDAAGRYTEEREQQRQGGGATTLTVTDLVLRQQYDGDGHLSKRVEDTTTQVNSQPPIHTIKNIYYVRSSLLGGKAVLELEGTQVKHRYIYAGSMTLARQWGSYIYWQNQNPVTASKIETATEGYAYAGMTELDPQGRDMGATNPYLLNEELSYNGTYASAGNGFDSTGYGCVMPDGMPAPCSVVEFAMRNGLYDRWANPVRTIEMDREGPWQRRAWDPTPNFMGVDYWAGPSLRSSSELERNPTWVELGDESNRSGFFIHESAPPVTKSCTFNVNLRGRVFDRKQLKLIEGEMNRLLKDTGHKVVLNTPKGAHANYTLNVANVFPGDVPAYARKNPGAMGFTYMRPRRPNEPGAEFSFALPGDKGVLSVQHMQGRYGERAKDSSNFAMLVARIGTHELIHYLWANPDHTEKGLMRENIPDYLSRDNSEFTISNDIRQYLDEWCNGTRK